MEPKDALTLLRRGKGLSQEEVAARVFVTRQAVSRWEIGETVPGVETLKLLSALYDVSINTLLGSPETLRCQRCGMPLEDGIMSREPDHTINQHYCQWCYADGKFPDMPLHDFIDFLVSQHFIPDVTDEQARAYYEENLPRLDYWKERL